MKRIALALVLLLCVTEVSQAGGPSVQDEKIKALIRISKLHSEALQRMQRTQGGYPSRGSSTEYEFEPSPYSVSYRPAYQPAVQSQMPSCFIREQNGWMYQFQWTPYGWAVTPLGPAR